MYEICHNLRYFYYIIKIEIIKRYLTISFKYYTLSQLYTLYRELKKTSTLHNINIKIELSTEKVVESLTN